MGYCEDN